MDRAAYLHMLASRVGRNFNYRRTKKLLEPLCTTLPITPAELLRGVDEGEREIALPPLSVRGAYQVLFVKEGKTRVRAERTAGSYAGSDMEEVRFALAGQPLPFASEMTAYAQQFWPQDLMIDTAKRRILFVLLSPKSSKEVARAGAWLTVDSLNRLSDDEISACEAGKLSANELLGKQFNRLFYCSLCGGALKPTCCPRCNIDFPRHPLIRNIGPTALPSKVVLALMHQGYTFEGTTS